MSLGSARSKDSQPVDTKPSPVSVAAERVPAATSAFPIAIAAAASPALLAKLGITSYSTARGKHATMDSFRRPYSAEERALILERMQYYYRQFLGAVGRGRKMTQDAVHEVARGRVWTGNQALKHRLNEIYVKHTGRTLEEVRHDSSQLFRPATTPAATHTSGASGMA